MSEAPAGIEVGSVGFSGPDASGHFGPYGGVRRRNADCGS